VCARLAKAVLVDRRRRIRDVEIAHDALVDDALHGTGRQGNYASVHDERSCRP
jgi:hypothetical protein